jgi:ADP-ribosyl-[dinitrogen reductase] hydrolase
MAILSQKENCEKALPDFLYEDLENEKYGKDFLIDLDRKLAEKFQ